MIAVRLLVVFFLLPMLAQAKEIEATAHMRQLADRVLGELTRPMSEEQRRAEVRRLLDENFDLAGTGRFALGRAGRGAQPAERGRFQAAFEDWLVRIVAGGLEKYDGGTLRLHSARPGGDGMIVVPSEYLAAEGPPVKVDWLLRPDKDSWRIADFTVEGMGFGMMMRTGINAATERAGESLEALIAKLGGLSDIAKRR